MKSHLLLSTISAVVLVGCGESQQSAPAPEAKPVEPVAGAKAPDISIREAAESGNIEAVRQHIAAGTDVNAADGDKYGTPLHQAFSKGHNEIVSLLRKHGGTMRKQGGMMYNLEGWEKPEAKPVEPVAEGELVEPVSEALKTLSRQDLFIKTIQGNIKLVKQLLAEGVDVNAKYNDGSTPLLHAVTLNHKEIAELLIGKGADINVKNDTGLTPLHTAKSDELFELLIANGADVNAKDKFGRTPLYYRSKRDSIRVNRVGSRNTKPRDSNSIGPAMPPLPFENELNEP